MDAPTAIAQAKDIIAVRRVFGGPIERDGVTIVPVAAVLGGLGGTTPPTTPSNSPRPSGVGPAVACCWAPGPWGSR